MRKILIFISIGFMAMLVACNNSNKFENVKQSEKIEINIPDLFPVYIIPNIHGVTGNHQRIIISQNNNSLYDKNTDYAFFTSEIYYKMQDKKLFIYAPESSIVEPNTSTFKDFINITPLKNYDEIKDYDENYETLKLKKVSVYSGDLGDTP